MKRLKTIVIEAFDGKSDPTIGQLIASTEGRFPQERIEELLEELADPVAKTPDAAALIRARYGERFQEWPAGLTDSERELWLRIPWRAGGNPDQPGRPERVPACGPSRARRATT